MIAEYQIQGQVTGVRVPIMNGRAIRRMFYEGEIYLGMPYYERTVPGLGQVVPSIITEESFLIPQVNVKKVRDLPIQGKTQAAHSRMDSTVKSAAANIAGGTYGKQAYISTKAISGGLIWGAAIGIVLALATGKGIVVYAAIGGIAGAIIGRGISKGVVKPTEKPTEK